MTAQDIKDLTAAFLFPGITIITLVRNGRLSEDHPYDSCDTGYSLKRFVVCGLLYLFDYWYYGKDFWHFNNNGPFLGPIIAFMYLQLIVTMGKIFFGSFAYKGYRSMGLGLSNWISAFVWEEVDLDFSFHIPHRKHKEEKKEQTNKDDESWDEAFERWYQEDKEWQKETEDFNRWYYKTYGKKYTEKTDSYTDDDFDDFSEQSGQNESSNQKSSYQNNTGYSGGGNQSQSKNTTGRSIYTAKELEAIRMLGLKEGFTKRDVHNKRIYFAKQYHPDVSKGASSEERMAAINNACDILEHCSAAK